MPENQTLFQLVPLYTLVASTHELRSTAIHDYFVDSDADAEQCIALEPIFVDDVNGDYLFVSADLDHFLGDEISRDHYRCTEDLRKHSEEDRRQMGAL